MENMQANSKASSDDVAVIGMSCRFPGEATSPESFLSMLKKGEGAWSEVPKERFDIDAYYHPSHEHRGTSVARGGHFLKENPAHWDAPFFSTTVAEANAMDPQQRILLEVAFESLESAGLPMSTVAGSEMACFIGSFCTDYQEVSSRDLNDKPLYSATGTGLTLLSNRISWFYDLKGPSATLDTACSSSLVALHMACETIRSTKNNTRTALVGGCGLILGPETLTSLSALHFVSPDSRSYSFDERANGYARGEGAGIVVLKHIDDAIRDGDTIRAVIRGTGVNQDGKTSGITLPSSEAQADLIRSTYALFGLELDRTAYFEAHGTGTQAGDPLEARAIGTTFGADPKRKDSIYIGSVKSNIGHLEGGAGIAGLIKSILSLESGFIFPQHDFRRPNPKLDLVKWKLKIPTSLVPWPRSDLRRISINSFGYGGTNAHTIVDDAFNYLRERGIQGVHNTAFVADHSSVTSSSQDSGINMSDETDLDHRPDYFPELVPQQLRIFTIMSSEHAAIPRIASELKNYLHNKIAVSNFHADQYLENLAYTLGARRSGFHWRAFAVASNAQELQESIESAAKTAVRANKIPKLLWVFTGQGAQYARMGADLLQYEIFADVIRSADEYLTSLGAGWKVKDELLAPEGVSRINEPQYSQPLCTIVQIGIIEQLRHWGLRPTAVVGHSSGEIAAAYAIGALSAEDACKIAYHRGRLSQQVAKLLPQRVGAMLSVGLSREDVSPYLSALPADSVAVVACVNSPSNVTVSGDKGVLETLEKEFQAIGVFARMLKVKNAYHSPYMKVIANDYLESLQDIDPSDNQENVRMYSTVYGSSVTSEELGAEYWVENMTHPVEFVAALEQIFMTTATKQRKRRKNQDEIDIVLEIGPHGALQGPVKQFLTKHSLAGRVPLFSILSRGQNGVTTTLNTMGRLWSAGSAIHLPTVNQFGRKAGCERVLVDLPPYPWNHSGRYWHESSQSRNHRHPLCGRFDYAGMPVEDFNFFEPLFKNTLRTSELPWLLDHKVQNDIIFPAAGMICAAIEVGGKLQHEGRQIIGFELRDICLGQALIIPSDDSGVETFLQLRPRKAGMRSDASSWQEWTFYTISRQGVPTEHGSGLISLVYASTPSEVDNGKEDSFYLDTQRQIYETSLSRCTRSVSKTQHYECVKKVGINYGPTFQGLGEIVTTALTACTKITIPDTRAVMPAQAEMQSVIHPAVLDALFQSCFPALTGDGTEIKETMVPTMIDGIFVPFDIPHCAGESFRAVTRISKSGFRDLRADMVAENGNWNRPCLTVTGLTVTAVGSDSGRALKSAMDAVVESKICSESISRVDLTFLSRGNAQEVLGKSVEPIDSLRQFRHDSAKAAAIWAKRTLEALTPHIVTNMAWHFRHYQEWLQRTYETAKAKKHPHQAHVEDWLCLSEEEEDNFLADFCAANQNDGLLMNCIGENLPQIMSGEVQALSVMLENDMLSKSYTNSHGMASGTMIVRDWFDLAGHKNPTMKVLEIGAGTASSTLPALTILGGQNGAPRRFESYTFTDISSGFFEKAQDVLREWGGLIDYRKLDIEKDPEEQGFALGSFDVIAATNVLHATSHMDLTLKNCFKLLKPGGRLILGENTTQSDYTSMTYGILPGWWLSEDGRQGGPLMSEQQWDIKLREAGFSGVDYSACDAPDKDVHTMTVMASTRPFEDFQLPQTVLIVVQPGSHLQKQVADVLSSLAAANGIEARILPLELAAQETEDCMTISLCELTSTILSDVSSNTFEDIKAVVLNSSRLLWVTSSSTPHSPDQSTVSGLFRCAMCENDALRLHELHLTGQIETRIQESVQLIFKAFTENFASGIDLGESEMYEVGGLVHIPRYVDSIPINDHLQRLHTQPTPELQPLVQEGRPLKLTVGSPGILDSLHFIDDKSHDEPLPPDHVEIRVLANALNFLDVMVAMGKVPDSEIGVDGTGVVTRIGSTVTKLKVGDRVAVIKFGCFASFMRCHESLAQIVPQNLTLEEACTMPTVFMTAYQCLIEIGRLEPGETILIHAASGGMGQALIQLAQNIGAEIYATVGTLAKKELLIGLGVQEDHIFSSRDLSFARGIMRMTEGRGVDLAVNSLAGEGLRKTWDCVAEFGRFLEIGKVDIYGNTGLEMMPFLKNRTFACVNLEHLARSSASRGFKLLGKVFELAKQGKIKPVRPITVYDWSDMESAFRTLQQGRHTGKLVLKVSAESQVQVLPRQPRPLELDPKATYILSGGLGGLGRSQAVYMAQHGARNLVFLSRSGAAKPEAAETIKELRALGVRAEAVACDITDYDHLHEVVSSLAQSFPPIKGVVQGAMVLNDGLLQSMSHKQWLAATRPKIQGTWNLHNALPKDVDFFIMLSSCAGLLGNRGQANYAAGNTFQDAFASYRRSLGLKAQSLDLGIITGIGFYEENTKHDATNYMNLLTAIHINADCFLTILGSAMSGFSEGEHKLPAQLMIGAGTGGLEKLNQADGKGRDFFWFTKFARLSYLRSLDARGVSSVNDKTDTGDIESLRMQLVSASSIQQASEICQEALVMKLAKSIMINSADIDTSKPLHHFGVDSLVAVEVRTFIIRELKSDISVFEILANNPISQLAGSIATKSRLLPKELTEDTRFALSRGNTLVM